MRFGDNCSGANRRVDLARRRNAVCAEIFGCLWSAANSAYNQIRLPCALGRGTPACSSARTTSSRPMGFVTRP